jgi:hypothetical protein
VLVWLGLLLLLLEVGCVQQVLLLQLLCRTC